MGLRETDLATQVTQYEAIYFKRYCNSSLFNKIFFPWEDYKKSLEIYVLSYIKRQTEFKMIMYMNRLCDEIFRVKPFWYLHQWNWTTVTFYKRLFLVLNVTERIKYLCFEQKTDNLRLIKIIINKIYHEMTGKACFLCLTEMILLSTILKHILVRLFNIINKVIFLTSSANKIRVFCWIVFSSRNEIKRVRNSKV